jgi:hypothetical protein
VVCINVRRKDAIIRILNAINTYVTYRIVLRLSRKAISFVVIINVQRKDVTMLKFLIIIAKNMNVILNIVTARRCKEVSIALSVNVLWKVANSLDVAEYIAVTTYGV